MEKGDKGIFFVEVKAPDEARRGILESLKGIVENLQKFEKFKTIRKEKILGMNKLRTEIKEIHKLASNLKNFLPESKLNAIKSERLDIGVREKRTKIKSKAKEVEEKKPLSDLEKLESELSEIESKLSGLR